MNTFPMKEIFPETREKATRQVHPSRPRTLPHQWSTGHSKTQNFRSLQSKRTRRSYCQELQNTEEWRRDLSDGAGQQPEPPTKTTDYRKDSESKTFLSAKILGFLKKKIWKKNYFYCVKIKNLGFYWSNMGVLLENLPSLRAKSSKPPSGITWFMYPLRLLDKLSPIGGSLPRQGSWYRLTPTWHHSWCRVGRRKNHLQEERL